MTEGLLPNWPSLANVFLVYRAFLTMRMASGLKDILTKLAIG